MCQNTQSSDLGRVGGEEAGLWAVPPGRQPGCARRRLRSRLGRTAARRIAGLAMAAGARVCPADSGGAEGLSGAKPSDTPGLRFSDAHSRARSRQHGSAADYGHAPALREARPRSLAAAAAPRQSARFFEIGYGTGTLLKIVADAGFPMAGIEVASALRQQAVGQIGPKYATCLHLGEFLQCEAPLADGPWSLVYWNDVFEHVPPDEIGDWLRRIHAMLAPGGQLVTITPNWHYRPSDVTSAVCPPRTEPAGLHLKEYTLVEVSRMLRRAGFARGGSAGRLAAAGCLVRPRPDRLEAAVGAGSGMAAVPVRQAPLPRAGPLLHRCHQRVAATAARRFQRGSVSGFGPVRLWKGFHQLPPGRPFLRVPTVDRDARCDRPIGLLAT